MKKLFLPVVICVVLTACASKKDKATVYCEQGLVLDSLKDYKGAVAKYDAAIAINDTNAALYLARGVAEARIINSLEYKQKAIADFNKVIELNPSSTAAYLDKGSVEDAMQQYDDAYDDYSKAIQVDRFCTEAYCKRGFLNGILRKLEDGMADCNKAIEINPHYSEAYHYRGVTELLLECQNKTYNFDAAEADFVKAIAIKPDYVEAYTSLALVKSIRNDYAGAIRELTTAIEIKPDMISAYIERGKIYYNIGDSANEESDFKHIKALIPNVDSTGYVHGLIKGGCR